MSALVKKPARLLAKIRHVKDAGEFPYFYTLDAYLPGEEEPAYIDYGAVESLDRAKECIAHVLANRGQADNADLYHVGVKR